MYRTKILIAFILISLSIMGCSTMPTQIDRPAEIAAVEKTIHASIEWCFPDKNEERCFAHCLRDSTFFIFHPNSGSTIRGYDHFHEYAMRIFFDPRFKAVSSDIREMKIDLSEHGDVAWFSCLLDDEGEWDGQRIGWWNARWTGVLVKKDGKWLMAQQHFSLPTDLENKPPEEQSAG
jgi:ketosteroid isomerase-like protein